MILLRVLVMKNCEDSVNASDDDDDSDTNVEPDEVDRHNDCMRKESQGNHRADDDSETKCDVKINDHNYFNWHKIRRKYYAFPRKSK